MKRLLVLSTVLVLPLSVAPAFAQCSPDPVSSGGSVTCSGTDSNGFSSASGNISVTVQSGATVNGNPGFNLSGTGVTVTNNGTIASTGTSGSAEGIDGRNGLTVINTGTISSLNSRAIDADARNDVRIENSGTITAFNKAIRNQNGANGILVNSGTIRSETNEGYESGDNANITNSGLIEAQDDAVQVNANATIVNSGIIRSFRNVTPDAEQQDAIDIDSGSIENTATGKIISEANAAIDYDGSTVASTVLNRGLISGTTGILVDKDPLTGNTAAQIVDNYGTIEGTEGLALDVGAGDDVLNLFGGSTLIGGIDMGADDDTLNLFDDLAGKIAGGAVLDGGAGVDLVDFNNLTIASVLRAWGNARVFNMVLKTPTSGYSVALTNWEGYKFGNDIYDRAQIEAVAPVPLPAAGLLMLAGLGGLAALRRRNA